MRPARSEQAALSRILSALGRDDGQPTGRLFKTAFADASVERRAFEHLLGGLVRAGLVHVREETFEKNSETVTYQRAFLTADGRARCGTSTQGITVVDRPPRAAQEAGAEKGALPQGGQRSKKWS